MRTIVSAKDKKTYGFGFSAVGNEIVYWNFNTFKVF